MTKEIITSFNLIIEKIPFKQELLDIIIGLIIALIVGICSNRKNKKREMYTGRENLRMEFFKQYIKKYDEIKKEFKAVSPEIYNLYKYQIEEEGIKYIETLEDVEISYNEDIKYISEKIESVYIKMESLKEFMGDSIVMDNEYGFFPYDKIFMDIAYIRSIFDFMKFNMGSVDSYIRQYKRVSEIIEKRSIFDVIKEMEEIHNNMKCDFTEKYY